MVGIDPSSASPRVNQYESGKHLPDFRIAARMADALEVPVTYLYAEDDRLAEMILAFCALGAKKQIEMLEAVQGALPGS